MRRDAFFAILAFVPEDEKKGEARKEQIPKGAPFDKGNMANFSAWQLSWELGYTIAIPIVLFALLGRWADKTLNTSPWFLLAGILVSIVASSAIVYRKVSKILH